jgi:hypothetical protein
MQISGVNLTLTWPHRLCLLRVLLGTTTIATSFPLSKHTGEGGSTPAFASQYVYLQFMWELGLPPLSCVVFLLPPLLQDFLLLVAGRVPLLLPSPASLFIYSSLGDCPSPPLALRVPCPLYYMSFLLLVIIQFLFFPWVGGLSVQGAMLIWPRVVCGSTTCRLAHFVVSVFPSGLGSSVWQHWRPPGFSI